MSRIDFKNISKRAGYMAQPLKARHTTKTNVNKIWYTIMGKAFAVNIFMLK